MKTYKKKLKILVMKKFVLFFIALALSTMTNAFAIGAGSCGENVYWFLENGKLTIKGIGDMDNYEDDDHNRCPWWKDRFEIYKVEIEDGVTSIGDYAFDAAANASEIIIPNSVKSIGKYAFYYWIKAATITLPDGVTAIGEFAFAECERLTSINIPNSVTAINKGVFWACTSLTSITIPNGVETINDYVFFGCTGLTSITIPNSVTHIGNYTFEGCTGLTSVTIPKSVESIYVNPFKNCPNIEKIAIEEGNTRYDSRDDCNAIIDKNKKTMLAGCKNTIIPSTITGIEYAAFSGNTSLTTITIPSNIERISGRVFYECTNLKDVKVLATKAPTPLNSYPPNDDMFSDYTIPLYVPAESIDNYKATSPWNRFTTILPLESSNLASQQNKTMKIEYNDGTLYINDANNGALVNVYTAKGHEIGSAVINNGKATISISLPQGSIAIVKIGQKSEKVIIK